MKRGIVYLQITAPKQSLIVHITTFHDGTNDQNMSEKENMANLKSNQVQKVDEKKSKDSLIQEKMAKSPPKIPQKTKMKKNKG